MCPSGGRHRLHSRVGDIRAARPLAYAPTAVVMTDDDLWLSPLLKTSRTIPREPEPLWEVRSPDHHTWSALLSYHGEWGVEAQIYRDGNFVSGGVSTRRPRRLRGLRLNGLSCAIWSRKSSKLRGYPF